MSLLSTLMTAEEELLLPIVAFRMALKNSGEWKSSHWMEFWVVHLVIYFV